MTTPTINQPYGIITDALVDAGKIQETDNPNSEQLASGMRRLRDLVNTWQTQGLKLFLNQDITVPLTAGKATYNFGPAGDVVMTKPLRVIQGYYLYTTGSIRRPFTPLAWNDYLTLGQAGTATANQGPINSYFVDKQATQLAVTFWLCPDTTEAANGAAHLLMQIQAANPISLTETMAFPEEWRMALRWGLADEMATGQPQTIMARCQQRAQFYRAMLEDWDVEDAQTNFAPDQRSMYSTGGFR